MTYTGLTNSALPGKTANAPNFVAGLAYSWDTNGNLLADGTQTFGYDANGNRLNITNISGEHYVNTSYTFNIENRLTQVLAAKLNEQEMAGIGDLNH